LPYDSRRYGYWPPASGYIADSSATESAPSSDTMPPTTHTAVIVTEPWTAAATVAGTMKMADAIVVPALSMIASKSVSSRLRSLVATEGDVMGQQNGWKVGRLEGYVQPSNLPTYNAASL